MNKFAYIATTLALLATASLAATPESLYRDAKGYEERGDYVRAIETYREFLNEFPKHSQVTEARYRLARSQDAIGLIDEAIANLTTVVKKGSDRFRKRQDAMFMLGKLLGDVERFDEAIKIFESLQGEGAGLYGDEVLNLLGGYYAVQEKYNEAAAKFNILKRRASSRYAEASAHKLVMIWIRAGNLDLAVDAVSDLVQRWPQNDQARALMLRIADKFREQRKFDQALAACDQLRKGFSKTHEGQAAAFLAARVYYDREEFDTSAEAYEAAARLPKNRTSGLAAEAMLQAADLYFAKLNQKDKAMGLYEEAATLARQEVSDRDRAILEQCYFRLGEHYYAQEKWAVALEYYALMRDLGTKINILPRLMDCQAKLNMDFRTEELNEKEIEFIRKSIKENPGTFAAAEGEVFLLDRQLETRIEGQSPVDDLITLYRDVLKRYPADALQQYHLESYIYVQIGRCYARNYSVRLAGGLAGLEWQEAITTFERALEVDPETPYRIDILEALATVCDISGQTEKAFEAYRELYTLTKKDIQAQPDQKERRVQMTEYLRSMLTRADEGDSITKALAEAAAIFTAEGKDSEAARHAKFYMGDLYYIKKDFPAAAAAYQEFIRTYGPPQSPQGDVSGGPWKPTKVSETVEQVYLASVRVAHSWYLNGHEQNMLKAYAWLVKNFPHGNMHVGEAEYWLAMELDKGEAGKTAQNQKQLADRLWKRVVNPTMDFEAADFRAKMHPWARDPDGRKYAQVAILKSGELYSGLNQHRLAADIFSLYLALYPPKPSVSGSLSREEELSGIARYALGREYITLDEFGQLVDTYRPYTDGYRRDPLRVSALTLLGYHASRNDAHDDGIKAYATLLDEYGRNLMNKDDDVIAWPKKKWLRKSNPSWNGIRMDPPEDLDLGAMRYALGFIYWKMEDWDNSILVLWPFIDDADLRDNKARAKSLHMAGRCYFKKHDYTQSFKVMSRLVGYPSYANFEAIEEAYVYAARAGCEVKQWKEINALYRIFLSKYSTSLQRPHMDLYEAVAIMGRGDAIHAIPKFDSLAGSDTYQDVKADARYHLGLYQMNKLHEDYKKGMKYLESSIRLYPREQSCFAAARCAMKLNRWDKALVYLERTLRDFPAGNPGTRSEAAKLLPMVRKKVAGG
jgi:tetratricopeptide (TPR) repeat protein